MLRVGKSRYYYYDLAGRLTAIKHQRGIDSFICKPFNKHVDDVLHNSDEIVRSRTEGIWPEDVLRFIQDSSSSGNRQRIFKKDAIGGDAPRFDLLKTNGFVFSKKLRRRVGELSSVDEFAMFLREERDRMIEYSYYIKFGSSAEFIQTTYAVRKRNKWLVRLTNKSYSYRIPISVMPKRISFPHFRYHFKYEFFD